MRLAPNLHRIGSDFVNAYLVEDAGGVTIVDAGLPRHWRELKQELAQLGYSLDDVRGIVLTHGDTDHIGFAERLRQENRVLVRVHELDAARARGQVSKPNWAGDPSRSVRCWASSGTARDTGGSASRRSKRSRPLLTVTRSICPDHPGSSTFRGTPPGVSPYTYQQWTRYSSATP
jgi:glyoxylase-like metal-dependent hydrolase (beta-lactamase superfamily II)